ncbi:MAG: hypothetical protein PF638_11080 [Candidatus Delongbacteria bacterium]|jgi:hypothetical protein|nr:hypothetical protein [Candidatus Delongbacteria bacterium]
MKKHFVIALLLVAISLFSQFEITKNEGFISAGTGYMINAERFTGNSLTNIAIPYGSYQLEGKTDEKSIYYVYADGGLNMNSFSESDELPENETPFYSTDDSFAYDLGLFVNPMIKYFMKDSTFTTVGLPFSFVSKSIDPNSFSYIDPTPQATSEDTAISSDLQLAATAVFGYDTRDIEFHVLSPWDKFEEGMAAYGFIKYGLFKHYTFSGMTETQEDKLSAPEHVFGIEGCYSYLMEDYKLLVKPIASFEMQFNDATDQYQWYTGKVFAAWDYSKKINVNGTLGMKFGTTGESEDDDYYNAKDNLAGNTTWFMINAEVNYYVKPELNIFFGFEGESLLFAVQDDDEWQRNASELNIRFGATYQLNFVNEY